MLVFRFGHHSPFLLLSLDSVIGHRTSPLRLDDSKSVRFEIVSFGTLGVRNNRVDKCANGALAEVR